MTHTAPAFWSWQLLLALGLNCAVQALAIAAYAARLAGALSGRVATAISLYNVFSTTSRFASMIYTPMLGSLSDKASAGGTLHEFEWQLRWVIVAGTAGTILGTLALPAFLRLYLRTVKTFERVQSLPRAALRLFKLRTMLSVLADLRFTDPRSVLLFSARSVPKDILILNALVTAVYAVGIVAAAYASVLDPGAARTALLFSGLVNGIGVIAYNVVVDPTAAFITDQAVRGERSVDDVRSLVTYLSVTAIAGYLLSQALLLPAAYVLEWTAQLITGK